jgi:hypothetical protein
MGPALRQEDFPAASFQIWKPYPGEIPPKLIQEFQYPNAFIVDMGWINIERQDILYLITRAFPDYVNVTCFVFKGDMDSVRILSEDEFYGTLLWFEPDIPSLGPGFIYIRPSEYWNNPENLFENQAVGLLIHSDRGYLLSHLLGISELANEQEWDSASNAEELQTIISYNLKHRSDWVGKLLAYDNPGLLEERHDVDGSTYMSNAMPGWTEKCIDE